jgi:hypothetical protein
LSPFSGSNSKPNEKPAYSFFAFYELYSDILLGALFDLEDGGDMFLRKLSLLQGVMSQMTEPFEHKLYCYFTYF